MDILPKELIGIIIEYLGVACCECFETRIKIHFEPINYFQCIECDYIICQNCRCCFLYCIYCKKEETVCNCKEPKYNCSYNLDLMCKECYKLYT